MTAINRSALNRSAATSLLKKIQEGAKKPSFNNGPDNRFWKPTVDAAGNAFAVIRFLPSKTEETMPFVKTYSHGFQHNGKWLIEECPTTINKVCPICQANSALWNSGFEADKEVARSRKRRLKYIANILVLKDPKNPENEGKVKLFSFGQKIFDKLQAVMNPPAEYGDEPRDPFSFFDGCQVKYKQKKVGQFPNMDDTVVENAGDLYDGDEDKLMEVLEAMVDLNEFLDESKFKSEEELQARLNKVLGEGSAPAHDEDEVEQVAKATGSEYGASSKMDALRKKAAKPVEEDEAVEAPKPTAKAAPKQEEEEDDDLAFFRSLADE
jgi:gp32